MQIYKVEVGVRRLRLTHLFASASEDNSLK